MDVRRHQPWGLPNQQSQSEFKSRRHRDLDGVPRAGGGLVVFAPDDGYSSDSARPSASLTPNSSLTLGCSRTNWAFTACDSQRWYKARATAA